MSPRKLPHPCSVAFGTHIYVTADGQIEGLSAVGKAHIALLKLDSDELTRYRKQIIETIALIEHRTDTDALTLLRRWVGFPDDLPNLSAKWPPGGNTFPQAAQTCYFQQRQSGNLPDCY